MHRQPEYLSPRLVTEVGLSLPRAINGLSSAVAPMKTMQTTKKNMENHNKHGQLPKTMENHIVGKPSGNGWQHLVGSLCNFKAFSEIYFLLSIQFVFSLFLQIV